jgi:hypothetical protein
MRKVHLGRALNDYAVVMVGESTAELAQVTKEQ